MRPLIKLLVIILLLLFSWNPLKTTFYEGGNKLNFLPEEHVYFQPELFRPHLLKWPLRIFQNTVSKSCMCLVCKTFLGFRPIKSVYYWLSYLRNNRGVNSVCATTFKTHTRHVNKAQNYRRIIAESARQYYRYTGIAGTVIWSLRCKRNYTNMHQILVFSAIRRRQG